MTISVRCLIADDCNDDAEILARHLRRAGHEIQYRRVDTQEDLEAALQDGEWDVVLCDYRMPCLDVMTVISQLAEHKLDIPVIVVSGALNEENLVGLMKAGAHDVIVKGNLARLSPAIEREVGDAKVRDAVRRKNRKVLSHMALHDPLTGLPNRTLFMDRLEHAIQESRRREKTGALLFLDLDHFKDVNDTLGHPVGDEMLKFVADKLSACAREADTVARLGGDEFAIVATDLGSGHDIVRLAESIQAVFRQPIVAADQRFNMSISIGITVFPSDGDSATALLKNADLALYGAKADGRANFRFYDRRMTTEVEARKAIENDMRDGLDRDEFHVEYQPVMDVHADRLVAVEALLRWNRPDFGPTPPDLFIPVAERSGLIVPLGARVVETALAALKGWRAQGLGIERVCVNVSPAQLKTATFVPFVQRVLNENDLAGHNLEIEITENLMLHHVDTAGPTLEALHDMGVQIAVDDFGTGYSSLTYLKQFPVNRLKIDRSFVDGVIEDPDDQAIARSVIGLAKGLNIEVVAEGVEKEKQLDWLRRQGCDAAQGYYFSKPLRDRALAAWARRRADRQAVRASA